MPVNLASKFESKVSDLMKHEAKTASIINQNWSWTGVNEINVYTLTDPTVGDYNVAGASNRYGTPSEVEDTTQTFTLTRDRSFSKVMDMLNVQDTAGIRKPGKYIKQAVRNVMVPEIDTYRLSVLETAAAAANRDDIVADGATDASNAYTNFVTINADITDNEAPTEGRVALMTSAYYSFLKQSGTLDSSDLGYKDRKSGTVGTLDGVRLVVVPSNRMPANTDLIITHPVVMVAPEKLKDVKVHKNAPGYNGYLIEYRHRYDAFVDTNKVNAVGIHKTV